jgi:hypothetical protein
VKSPVYLWLSLSYALCAGLGAAYGADQESAPEYKLRPVDVTQALALAGGATPTGVSSASLNVQLLRKFSQIMP